MRGKKGKRERGRERKGGKESVVRRQKTGEHESKKEVGNKKGELRGKKKNRKREKGRMGKSRSIEDRSKKGMHEGKKEKGK